jgi:hypothetical protein
MHLYFSKAFQWYRESKVRVATVSKILMQQINKTNQNVQNKQPSLIDRYELFPPSSPLHGFQVHVVLYYVKKIYNQTEDWIELTTPFFFLVARKSQKNGCPPPTPPMRIESCEDAVVSLDFNPFL